MIRIVIQRIVILMEGIVRGRKRMIEQIWVILIILILVSGEGGWWGKERKKVSLLFFVFNFSLYFIFWLILENDEEDFYENFYHSDTCSESCSDFYIGDQYCDRLCNVPQVLLPLPLLLFLLVFKFPSPSAGMTEVIVVGVTFFNIFMGWMEKHYSTKTMTIITRTKRYKLKSQKKPWFGSPSTPPLFLF